MKILNLFFIGIAMLLITSFSDQPQPSKILFIKGMKNVSYSANIKSNEQKEFILNFLKEKKLLLNKNLLITNDCSGWSGFTGNSRNVGNCVIEFEYKEDFITQDNDGECETTWIAFTNLSCASGSGGGGSSSPYSEYGAGGNWVGPAINSGMSYDHPCRKDPSLCMDMPAPGY